MVTRRMKYQRRKEEQTWIKEVMKEKSLPVQRSSSSSALLIFSCQLIKSRIITSIPVCCFTYVWLWAAHESEMKSVLLP